MKNNVQIWESSTKINKQNPKCEPPGNPIHQPDPSMIETISPLWTKTKLTLNLVNPIANRERDHKSPLMASLKRWNFCRLHRTLQQEIREFQRKKKCDATHQEAIRLQFPTKNTLLQKADSTSVKLSYLRRASHRLCYRCRCKSTTTTSVSLTTVFVMSEDDVSAQLTIVVI